MLSQSDIFNRLPISDEQKKNLLDLMLNAPRVDSKHPVNSFRTLIAPVSPTPAAQKNLEDCETKEEQESTERMD